MKQKTPVIHKKEKPRKPLNNAISEASLLVRMKGLEPIQYCYH